MYSRYPFIIQGWLDTISYLIGAGALSIIAIQLNDIRNNMRKRNNTQSGN